MHTSEIRYREMFKSDMQHIGPMYVRMYEEAYRGEGAVPYPDVVDREKAKENVDFLIMSNIQFNPRWKGFVALHGSVTKGFLTAIIQERPVGEPRLYLQGELFYIDPKFRGGIIGQELMKRMVEWGSAQGAG